MTRCDHPTAETVYRSLQKQFPNISLGTVYRNLDLLSELGEVQKLACGDGKDHFDWNTAPHYHFVCRHCGAVLDLPLTPYEDLQHQAQKIFGGTVDSHMVYFYGRCALCEKTAK